MKKQDIAEEYLGIAKVIPIFAPVKIHVFEVW